MAAPPDLSSYIGDIARLLLGTPNKTLSTRTQWRYGNHGSIAVEVAGPQRGQWYNHEAGIGGGPWEMLHIIGRLEDGQAEQWLHDKLGIGKTNGPSHGRQRVIKAYFYHDEAGAVLFKVNRWGPEKRFTQHAPDGNGGWTKGKGAMTGVRRVLYRLPELIAAKGKANGTPWRVYLVEGEKDADNIARWGVTATANPMGAGKWLPQFNRYFAGSDAVIIADNDAAGRQHAAAVAAQLATVAGIVRVIELGGLDEKGDISDWIEDGGLQSDLETLIEQTPPYQPSGAHDPKEESFNDAAEIERLAKLKKARPLAYEREREIVAKNLGIRVTMLDKIVNAECDDTAAVSGQGKPIELTEIEAWPEPIDGAGLLDELTAAIQSHVILDLAAARGVALWVVFTHAFAVASFAPKLLISSPVKRSGKTRLMTVLNYLVARPLPLSGAKAAALFRVIEEHCPTLLIDEGDTFIRDDEELRGLLNSGFDREQAFVLRSVLIGDNWMPRRFSTWCPQAIAGIGGLAETIEDRGFRIALKRKLKGDRVARLRARDAGPLKALARKAARFAADHCAGLEGADPEMPAELNDRAADAWQLCIAIADLAGAQWPEQARRAALALSGDDAEDEGNPMIILLSDIRAAFAAKKTDRISSVALVGYLGSLDARPWPEMGRARKPISQNQVAQLLKKLKDPKLKPKTIRLSEGGSAKGYLKSAFVDAFVRWLPPEAAQPQSDAPDDPPF